LIGNGIRAGIVRDAEPDSLLSAKATPPFSQISDGSNSGLKKL